MSRCHQRTVLLLLVAVMVVFAVGAPSASADDPDPMSDFYEDPFDPFRDYIEVPLSKIMKAPGSFTNRHVEFRIFFHKVDENWTPFFSPYDPENFLNFSGWPIDNRLWVKEEMTNDFPFFYIANEHNDIDEILQANKFAIIELQGTVTNVMEGYPFIQIRHADILYNDVFTEHVLRLLILGHEHLAQGNLDKGIERYKRALRIGSDKVPPQSLAAIHREMAIAYYKKKNYEWALDHALRTLSHKDGRDEKMSLIRRKSWKAILARRRGEPIENDEEMESGNSESEESGDSKNRNDEGGDDSSFVPPEKFRESGARRARGALVIERLKKEIQKLSHRLEVVRKRERSLKNENSGLKTALSRVRKKLAHRRKQVNALRDKLHSQYRENAQLFARIRQLKEKTRRNPGHFQPVAYSPGMRNRDQTLAAAAVFEEVNVGAETRTQRRLEKVMNKNSELRSRVNDISSKYQSREKTIKQLKKDLREMYRKNARLRMKLMEREKKSGSTSGPNPEQSGSSNTETKTGEKKNTAESGDIELPPYPRGRLVTGGFRSREEVRKEMNRFKRALRKHYPRYRNMKDRVLEKKIRNHDLDVID